MAQDQMEKSHYSVNNGQTAENHTRLEGVRAHGAIFFYKVHNQCRQPGKRPEQARDRADRIEQRALHTLI